MQARRYTIIIYAYTLTRCEIYLLGRIYLLILTYLLTYYSTDNDDDDLTPLMETTIRLVARAIFIRHPL